MFELLLFPIIVPSPPNPLLTNEYQIVVEAPPPELTLQEKIDQNINQCTDLQWISAEDASCIAKPVKKPVSKPVVSPTVVSGGLYTIKGQCTTYVASRRSVPMWGSAISWKKGATNAGWYVGPIPVAGAIGWSGNHVVYIESVNGDTVTISEANYDWKGSIRTVTRPISNYTYLY